MNLAIGIALPTQNVLGYPIKFGKYTTMRTLFGFLFLMISSLLVSAQAAEPAPFFVAVLVKKNNPNQVQTLSSYEMSTTLRLHPENASEATLNAQMQLQINKLKKIMPIRGQRMGSYWKLLSAKLPQMQLDKLIVPPGITWDDWAKPQDEDLKPVGVSDSTFDGRWFTYLDKNLFSKLSTFDQAQVLWQMMWAHDLSATENLRVRILTNYLAATEWKELTSQNSISLLQKLGFIYFENSGFCFEMPKNNDTVFYPNGFIKTGTASEYCVISYRDSYLIFTGKLEFDANGQLIGFANLNPKMPLAYKLGNQTFQFLYFELFPNGDIKSFSWDGFKQGSPVCVNKEAPFKLSLSYATLGSACVNYVSFYPTGSIERIGNAEADVMLNGKLTHVGDFQNTGVGYDLSFYASGQLQKARIRAGTTLTDTKQNSFVVDTSMTYEFNPQGLAFK